MLGDRARQLIGHPLGAMVPAPLLLGLVGLGIGFAWAAVHLSPFISAGLFVGTFVVAIWLLAPEAALYSLVLLVPFTLSYRVVGLRDVRVHDAVLIALMIIVAASVIADASRLERFRTPFGKAALWLWLFIAVWGSVTFLMGPANAWMIGDPASNTWYVYRAVMRPLLPFPLFVYCLGGESSARRTVDLLLIVSVAVSAHAIMEASITGLKAAGALDYKNALAVFLVLVIPFAVSRLLLRDSSVPTRLVYAGALLILLRGLWLTGSRGGMVCVLASLFPVAIMVPRRRLIATGSALLLGLALVVAAKGDLRDRPNMKRYLSLSNPFQVRNLQWRQEQWDLFADRIAERPWMGTGSDVDKSLIEKGRLGTAHNAFLAAALRSGVPAAVAWGCLLLMVGFISLRRAWRTVEAKTRAFWIGMSGFTVALLVNCMVETGLFMLQVQHLFWILLAVAVLRDAPIGKPDSDPRVPSIPGRSGRRTVACVP